MNSFVKIFSVHITQYTVLLVAFGFLLLTACSEESQQQQQQAQTLQDSVEMYEEPSSQNDVGKDSTVQIDPAAAAKSIEGKAASYMAAIFGDAYNKTEVTWEDEFPKFPTASKSLHFKYISTNPENTRVGKAIPRISFKAYQFPDEATLLIGFNSWLRNQESSEASLTIGQDAATFKSPPFVCAITKTEVYMMRSACIYQGAGWEQLKEYFGKQFAGKDIRYRFEVNCKAGQMTYDIVEGKKK